VATIEESAGTALDAGVWGSKVMDAEEELPRERQPGVPGPVATTLPPPLPRQVHPDRGADREPDAGAPQHDRQAPLRWRDGLILSAILLPQLAWMGLLAYLALLLL
jgi:hypothetical protein